MKRAVFTSQIPPESIFFVGLPVAKRTSLRCGRKKMVTKKSAPRKQGVMGGREGGQPPPVPPSATDRGLGSPFSPGWGSPRLVRLLAFCKGKYGGGGGGGEGRLPEPDSSSVAITQISQPLCELPSRWNPANNLGGLSRGYRGGNCGNCKKKCGEADIESTHIFLLEGTLNISISSVFFPFHKATLMYILSLLSHFLAKKKSIM